MAITVTQKILTLDYWKFADKIEVGDYVFNKDGDIVTVTKIHKYFSEDCHEVIFNDHTVMEGDKHLGFLIETPQYRKRANAYKGVQKFANKLKFTKLEDIIESPLKNERDRLVYSIPLTEPLKFPAQCHSVPAFIFGFWFKRPNLLPNKNTEDFIHKKFQSHGYKIKPIHSKVRNMILTPTIESQFAPYIPTRIPENYLMGSVEERIELLSGIIYAKPKQYRIRHNEFIIYEQHLSTALRLQFLTESLGIASILDKNCRGQYLLLFKTNLRLVEWQKPKLTKKHFARRFITEVKPIQSQMCVHIETSEGDNSLIVGEGFIATCCQ